MRKWFSYRAKAVLARDLNIDEMCRLTHMVRRIASVPLLEPRLDANYEAVKAEA